MACRCHALDRIPFAQPGSGPTYAPSRSARIEHASLTLRVWPEEARFEGEARFRLAAFPSAEALAFDLDVDEVLAVAGPEGPLAWRRVGEALLIDGPPPPWVEVHWRSRSPRRGLYFTGPAPHAPGRPATAWTQCQDEDAHAVFPCFDHPGVKHPWTLELEGPAGYTLLSNGRRVAGGERSGRAFARFEQEEPTPAYLITFVAAPLDQLEAEGAPVPVRYFWPAGESDEETVRACLGRTPAMLEHFAQLTGTPYPWPRYDQVVVHDFVFGGMENTGCTTLVDSVLAPPTARLEWDPDDLVSHELAHQWFGDLVTCQDWSQGWLNESFATFLEVVWREHRDGVGPDTVWFRHSLQEQYLKEHDERYRRPLVSYDFKEPIDVFDRHLYEKGACVLWTLRSELGEPVFWKGVQRYLADRAHQTAHTRDLQRALEAVSGRSLEGFFQQWVFRAGHPRLTVRWSQASGGLLVEVEQADQGPDVPHAWTLTLPLEAQLEGAPPVRVQLPLRERRQSVFLPVQGAVITLRVDPGLSFLGEVALSGPIQHLQALVDDACPVLASRAVRALAAKGEAGGWETLRSALKRPVHFGVRLAAVEALKARGGAADAQLLLSALEEESEPRVARALVEAVGRLRPTGAAAVLLACLDRGPATLQLEASIRTALGQLRDPAVELPDPESLASSWGEARRRAAYAALGQSRDARHVERLLAGTRGPGPDRVKAAAAAALAELGSRVEVVKPRALERLLELLQDPGLFSVLAAVDGLLKLEDPSARSALQHLSTSAADGRVRRKAYEALARLPSNPGAPLSALRDRVEALEDENRKLKERLERLEALVNPAQSSR